MDDIQDIRPPVDSGREPTAEAAELIEILIEGEGIESVEAVILPAGGTVATIVQFAARKGGYPESDAILFVEEDGQPLALDVVVSESYPHRHRKHHVHRVRDIEVVVQYMARCVEHRYPPSTKVETVLAWAIKAIGTIDAAIAPEFELALPGSKEELPGSKHIGSLVRHPCRRLVLDLVRGVIPNGAA